VIRHASTVTVIILIALFMTACSSKSGSSIDPEMLKGISGERTVSVDRTSFKFQVTEFQKPIKMHIIERKAATYSTPEEAVLSHLSAMKSLDYTWFRMSWDKLSLARLEERDKLGNVTPEVWKERWKKIPAPTFEMTHRIEYTVQGKPYTLVAYQWAADFPKQQSSKPHCIPLRKEGDRWYLTMDLAEDKGYGLVDELIQSGIAELVK